VLSSVLEMSLRWGEGPERVLFLIKRAEHGRSKTRQKTNALTLESKRGRNLNPGFCGPRKVGPQGADLWQRRLASVRRPMRGRFLEMPLGIPFWVGVEQNRVGRSFGGERRFPG